MKNRINGMLALLTVISLSCAHSVSDNYERIAFKKLLDKFQPLDLPITLRLDDEQLFREAEAIRSNTTDTLFIKPNGNFLSYGYIRDTSNYFTLIYSVIGDGPFFRIATFDKKYNKIDDASIMNSKGCTPGTLCLKCNTVIKIQEGLQIVTLDSLIYLYCEGNMPDSIIKREHFEQIMRINKKGKIEMIE